MEENKIPFILFKYLFLEIKREGKSMSSYLDQMKDRRRERDRERVCVVLHWEPSNTAKTKYLDELFIKAT